MAGDEDDDEDEDEGEDGAGGLSAAEAAAFFKPVPSPVAVLAGVGIWAVGAAITLGAAVAFVEGALGTAVPLLLLAGLLVYAATRVVREDTPGGIPRGAFAIPIALLAFTCVVAFVVLALMVAETRRAPLVAPFTVSVVLWIATTVFAWWRVKR